MNRHIPQNACLLLLSVMIAVVYLPGTGGIFLLDDYSVLTHLGNWGEIDNWHKWLSFVTEAYAGPTGRMFAVATFTANAISWPADPYWLLLTNIVIHGVNALLLLLVLQRLLAFVLAPNQAFYWALAATSIWALHPYQVSTVLYVVQRMTSLALTCNLLALIAYLTARKTMAANTRSIWIYFWLLLAGFCTFVGLFAKETVIIIPLQILLIELCLIKNHQGYPWPSKYLKYIVVLAPACLLIYVMGDKFLGYSSVWLLDARGFTVEERLLTEARIVGDYLMGIFIPAIQTSGVFHDGYPKSTSALAPVSTLVWLVIHSLVISVAVALRKSLPLFCFGILWFYLNHLLESVVVQLELKFEHRNYIPSIGLAVAIVALLVKVNVGNKAKAFITGLICLLLATSTYARASLWGNPGAAVLVWMDENPQSVRAVENALLHFSKTGAPSELLDALVREGLKRSGKDAPMQLKALGYNCEYLASGVVTLEELEQDLRVNRINWQLNALFEQLLASMNAGNCSQITLARYQEMIRAAKSNPAVRRTRINLYLSDLLARSELLLGSPIKAIEQYQAIQKRHEYLGLSMNQALLLASSGQQSAAAEILQLSIDEYSTNDQFLLEQAGNMLNRIKADVEDG